MDALQLTPSPGPRRGKRKPIDPTPRFKTDVQMQSDVIWGHLEGQVDDGHLVRAIWGLAQRFDVATVERGYSALGRHGYAPRRLLALWLYASIVGEHEASKLAARCRTDSAFRWICGGRTPSQATLKRFRHRNSELMAAALQTTIEIAAELDLVDVGDLATDSVRLRAHASTSAARTLERSRKRVAELLSQSLEDATEEARAKHERSLQKHEHAIAQCEAEGRTSIVVTNPLAGLLKFPDGGSAPGHRVTVTATGQSERLVLSVLIDFDANDCGKLLASIERARDAVLATGNAGAKRFSVAADAGYFTASDLAAARAAEDWLEVFVRPTDTSSNRAGRSYFGRDRFKIISSEPPVCPAGTPMGALHVRKDGSQEWLGRGCGTCSMRPACTPSKSRRMLVVIPDLEAMRERFKDPAVRARYNRRIATIEPVFAHLEDTMRYRRVTTRHPETIRSEILLKVVAHNVARILSARRLRLVHIVQDEI